MSDVIQTSIRRDHERRYGCTELRVYVNDTALHKVADHWFSRNNLYQMNIKSKAWNKIVRHLNTIIESKLAQHYKIPKEHVKYSRTCGCSCGCSPGYKLKQVPEELQYKDAWTNIQVQDYLVQSLKDLIASSKFQRIWDQDVQAENIKQAQVLA